MQTDPSELRKLYEQLVHEHAEELFRIAFRLTGRRETAEDLVSETFTEAWRSLPNLREPESARAWLFRILRFRHAHLLRDSGCRPQVDDSVELVRDIDVPSEDSRIGDDALTEPLQKALDSMDERFKVPFLMVLLLGVSCGETARQLEIPLGTVLSRVHRARQFLRQRLSGKLTGQSNVVALKGKKP
ncbi:MAG: RNA polymerase sigma factor [Candidatus Wallbacteria bacterium]|nr:RNA polymerase sigma factor [Candidatus Wallbacteria bacterium]